jgi:AAA ATPase-like protein
MTAANPFIGYGTLVSGERLIGRDQEAETLRRRLFEARSSAALIGVTRMGKSSLANQIRKEAPDERTSTGWINIATARSGAEVLGDILAMCPSEAPLHATFTTAGTAPAAGDAHDTREVAIHDLYRMIRTALMRLGRSGGHLVVILDEFDSVKNFPDARDFLNLLRELVYYPDQIPMAVLAVARRPIDRIEVEAADISTFAGVCDSIYLRPMDYEQVKAMAARSADLAGDAPDVAWKYAAGHPFLSEVAFCRMLEHGVTDIGRIIQSDLSSYYKKLEDFLRKEELWEPLLKLASGRGVEVDVEQGALVRRYGLIDDNGEVWSSDFADYLRPR